MTRMAGTESKPEVGRRFDVDWLRVLAMLTIFLFHNARFFDDGGWHVKNNQIDFGMTVFTNVVGQWVMPLFFVLSAISAYYALRGRGNNRFLLDRFKRLVIPLVFGIFFLIPPQVYIERVTHGQFTGSFFDFLPHYFDGWYAFGGNFAWMGLHLWYLEMLFLFSLLTLPLFRYLAGAGRNLASRPASIARIPGVIFLGGAVPIAVIEMIVNLQPNGIGIRDFGGWSPLTYLVIFLLGYIIALDPQFRQTIEKQRVLALVLAILATLSGFIYITAGNSDRTLVFSVIRGVNTSAWVIAILGFGSKYLNFNNAVLKYAGEAVLPFYILHQSVIVIIGFFIARWDATVMVKYLGMSSMAFVIIMGLYEFVVKRNQVLRFLFGMKLARAQIRTPEVTLEKNSTAT